MNLVFLCLVVVGASMSYAQRRSPYAPNPVGVVKVLPRFQEDEEPSNGTDTVNRFGEETARPAPSTPSSLAGSDVDPNLASRVGEWDPAHRPFWYENADAIRNHLQQNVNELPPPPPPAPSSFAANQRN